MKLKLRTYGPAWLGWSRYLPYPLRAARFSLDFNPFGFWWKPTFVHQMSLTEAARADGATIWWFRWLWFQVSYSRWV